MFFLSSDEHTKKVVMEEFLSSRNTHTLVIFRDEKEIPDTKKGVNLFAPYFECSFGFDPAFDILSGSATVNEAARAFSEALVTDGDMMMSRDPIWSYNSRGLLASLFVAGTALWKYLHKQSGGITGPDFPSLTDTIFGMIDDLSACRIRSGDLVTRTSMSFPEWWNIADDAEQEFIKSTVLGAPLNTAGSLLAVTNSYTGNIMRLYSGEKCPLLFNPDWPENVYVYLPAINAQMLDILLRTAKTVWKSDFSLVACGVSSWGKRPLAVLGNFLGESSMDDDRFLMLGTSPSAEILDWYSGSFGWGDSISAPALTFFRRKVEETTGNPNGLLTALHAETPERCAPGEWLRLTSAGWSVESIDEEKIESMKTRDHLHIRPEHGGQSDEVVSLRNIFGDGSSNSPFLVSGNGSIILKMTGMSDGEADEWAGKALLPDSFFRYDGMDGAGENPGSENTGEVYDEDDVRDEFPGMPDFSGDNGDNEVVCDDDDEDIEIENFEDPETPSICPELGCPGEDGMPPARNKP